jgi:hypothetical protein
VYLQQLPILEYCAKHEIIIEAYSALMFVSSAFFNANVDLTLTHWLSAHDTTCSLLIDP